MTAQAITGQLDLLALLDPKVQAAEHRAMFRRVWFLSAYTTSTTAAGELVLGWACPMCRGIEWNTAHLSINHALDPDVPSSGRWLVEARLCSRILLRRSQERRPERTPAGTVPGDELDEAADGIGVVRIPAGERPPPADRTVSGFGVCACGCSVLHHRPPPSGRHDQPLGACRWCGKCQESRP